MLSRTDIASSEHVPSAFSGYKRELKLPGMLSMLLGRRGYFNHSIKWHTHGSLKRWEGLQKSRLMEVWSNKMTCKLTWTSIRGRERVATCLCLHSKNPRILSALKNNTSSALIPYHWQLLPYLMVYPGNYTSCQTQTLHYLVYSAELPAAEQNLKMPHQKA